VQTRRPPEGGLSLDHGARIETGEALTSFVSRLGTTCHATFRRARAHLTGSLPNSYHEKSDRIAAPLASEGKGKAADDFFSRE
jgi:hypothetical protein